MSAREWKPGDVAMIEEADGTKSRAVRSADGSRWVVESRSLPMRKVIGARPLVVIDPEDREQVERLMDGVTWLFTNADVEATQAALREFANPKPPKPVEPTGLGAVVEDADGKRWVLSADADCANPWNEASGYDTREWSDIDAVRVLSEGVQP